SVAPLGSLRATPGLGLTPPIVQFVLKKALPFDKSEQFVLKLGPGASKTITGKTTTYASPSLDRGVLVSVLQVCAPYHSNARDVVNPEGLYAYYFLNDLFHTFLRVQSYPAFSDENGDPQILLEPKVTTPGKSTRKRTRQQAEREGSTSQPSEFMESASSTWTVHGGAEAVFKASPVRHKMVSVGSSTSIPKSPGNVFPYFTGLIQPDATFISSLILRHFMRILGSNPQLCQDEFVKLRHGIKSLSTTDVGMELCHIALGVSLALETQSRCFVIIDHSSYKGFCLLGARYTIFMNNKWIHAGSEKDLSKAIARVDPHEHAVEEIMSKLSELASKELYTGRVEKAIFQEPSTLVEQLGMLKLDNLSEDDVRELDRNLMHLNYSEGGFWSRNPHYVTEMLKLLSSGSEIELSRPTVIP
ncbi:hypothetical protein K3495_g15255, partial [Podosphaera aphanis]